MILKNASRAKPTLVQIAAVRQSGSRRLTPLPLHLTLAPGTCL